MSNGLSHKPSMSFHNTSSFIHSHLLKQLQYVKHSLPQHLPSYVTTVSTCLYHIEWNRTIQSSSNGWNKRARLALSVWVCDGQNLVLVPLWVCQKLGEYSVLECSLCSHLPNIFRWPKWSQTYRVFPTRRFVLQVHVLPVAYQVLCILHLQQNFNSKQLCNMSPAMSPAWVRHPTTLKVKRTSNDLVKNENISRKKIATQRKLPPARPCWSYWILLGPGLLSHTSPCMLPRLQLLAGGIDLPGAHVALRTLRSCIVASGWVALHCTSTCRKILKKVLHGASYPERCAALDELHYVFVNELQVW